MLIKKSLLGRIIFYEMFGLGDVMENYSKLKSRYIRLKINGTKTYTFFLKNTSNNNIVMKSMVYTFLSTFVTLDAVPGMA